MEFFESFVIPPSGRYLDLLEVLAVMTYLIHLPYVGILLGTTALSVWLQFSNHEIPNPRFARFADELIDTFLGNKLAMLIFGVFPLLVLPFIYTQWFVGAGAGLVLVYIPIVIPLSAVGFGLIHMYHRSHADRGIHFGRHMFYGLAAIGVLKISYFVLLAAVARLHDPEKWFRVKNVLVMLLNWNVIWKFAFFLHAAGVVTGAAILFFFFRWPGKNTEADPEYADFVRKWGGGITLVFLMALPVFHLFYVFTTPDVAFDNSVYLIAAALILVAMVAAFVAVGVLSNTRPRYATATLLLVLVIFVLASTGDIRSMATANYEHARLMEIAVETQKQTREAEIAARMASAHGEGVGEGVYNNVCVQCHRMDENLVGPALVDVLPGYANDAEALKSFISKPSKKNPEYPPMPNPGLSPAEVNAVANYLLEQIGASGDGGGGGH